MKDTRKIVIATQNQGKIKEIKEIFSNSGYQFLTYKNLEGFPQIKETGRSFYENARLKAEVLTEMYGYPAVSDDSGLEVDCLEGQPGIYSSRYGGEEGNDKKNIDKLLHRLRGVPKNERGAQFRCLALYLNPEGYELKANGLVRGKIIKKPRGEKGFGYDPIFVPEGYQQTMAELDVEEKNKISHRGQAFRQLLEALSKK